jgi:excisionase family DNA binding protein
MDVNRVHATAEVAEALGLSPATVQQYARNGRIPFDATPGGHRRFDIEEVRAALAAGCDRKRAKRPAAQVLVCAVCLYVSEDPPPPAVTVISGLAVCEDHAERAMDTNELWRIIAHIRKERQ